MSKYFNAKLGSLKKVQGDAELLYWKGRFNVVVDALNEMSKVSSLLFTKWISQGVRYRHDVTYSKEWSHVEMRDSSHSQECG